MNGHWTEGNVKDFLYRIASDYIDQLQKQMDALPISQAEFAKQLGVTEGRVSQILNKPGNLKLEKIIEYARALGLKVAIVAYNDGDSDNLNGPVNSEIFNICWERARKPADFVSIPRRATPMYYIESPQTLWHGFDYSKVGGTRQKVANNATPETVKANVETRTKLFDADLVAITGGITWQK